MRRLLAATFILAVCASIPVDVNGADKEKEKDSDKAAAARKALDSKITVDYKEEKVSDVADDLAKKIAEASKTEVKIDLDSKVSGVTRNAKITFASKDKPAKELLDEFCKANGYGWLIVSGTYSGGKKPAAYPAAKWDGVILITKGDERGYPDPEKK